MSSTEIDCVEDGYDAFIDGAPRQSNPHQHASTAWVAWFLGWDQGAQRNVADELTNLQLDRERLSQFLDEPHFP
jgi:hypothetical protein